jgi:hypothetical protein
MIAAGRPAPDFILRSQDGEKAKGAQMVGIRAGVTGTPAIFD